MHTSHTSAVSFLLLTHRDKQVGIPLLRLQELLAILALCGMSVRAWAGQAGASSMGAVIEKEPVKAGAAAHTQAVSSIDR